MKKFRFTLAAVRDMREAEEQAAQKRLGVAMRAENAALELLRALHLEQQMLWQTLRSTPEETLNSVQMRQAHSWDRLLEERRKEQAAEVARCQRQVELARQALQLARQRRETLDRLGDKYRAAHARLCQTEEQKFLDELALRVGQPL